MTLRTRAILVGGVVILMSLMAFPNLFSEEQRKSSAWIGDDALNLGLDLQGGVHWVLSIERETAVRQELSRTKDDLEQQAEEGAVELVASRIRDDGVLELSGDLPRLRGLIDGAFTNLDVTEVNGHLELELSDEWNAEVVRRGVRQALEVLQRRLDAKGVKEPVIRAQGEGRILVQMPGIEDLMSARSIIGKTTFLQFKKVLDAAPNAELLEASYRDGLPENTEIVDDQEGSESFLVPKEAILTGDMLTDARLAYDRLQRPIVTFTWDTEGTRLFREYTRENIGERMAAIIDGEVVTAPVIQSAIGRNGQIEGGFTPEEAANLAVALRSGALPIPLVIEEERTVGPSLGADSIRQGELSILLGLALVILFMAAYYGRSGWFANAALAINVVLIIGVMSLFQATLTLPGIAGLVLTVGMAVDANVIIFERIREELRGGKGLRNAVQVGFRRSALTIADANITTLIVAIILFEFGSGPVQGFGVTLAIGILSSVFAALVVTRLLFDLWMVRRPQAISI